MAIQSPDVEKKELEKREPKLLDRIREAARVRHLSLRTEKAYVHWAKRYILFHGKRHPQEMGEAEINAFLTHLAVEGRVSASTQPRLSAPCFSSTGRSSRGRWENWRGWCERGGRGSFRWC